VGDEYKNSGQVGAMGEVAISQNNTFNQTIIHQAAPVTYTALHQLPPPSADFVGREKEMAELLQALENGGVTISGLQGMGGIGKTALALKLAEQLKPQYSDAQFYLDLKGASKEPLTSAQVMAHVIRSYHPEAKMPEDENGLRGLYLSLLEGKKALLLMDNAASAAQVMPLIPPAGSLMLFTSRNHFTIGGFFVKHLDTLEPKDALELLLKIAPRIGDCAEKIAELCGYLPLALEVAASALNQAVNLTPAVYVKRLEKATKRLELIEASLTLSYDLLSIEMQRLWRSLAVFPNTFDDDAVAALWELSLEDTQDRLAELISYSLIEWNETTRRYRLHDLVQLFTDACLDGTERLKVNKLHASYFLNLLAQIDELYTAGGKEILNGLALFDLERENIEAGQRWAAAYLEEDNTATELSKDYYSAGVNVLALRLHPLTSIRWLEVSLNAARLLDHKVSESIALNNLASIYVHLGKPNIAIRVDMLALEIFREIGYRQGEGSALCNLGNAYILLGESQKAIEFHQQYLEIAQENGDRRGEGSALGNISTAYLNLGEIHRAIEFSEEGLEIAHELGDRQGEGDALGNLGLAYGHLSEYYKAINYLEQSLLIAREIGDRSSESRALYTIGAAYLELGDISKGITFIEQALLIAREIGDRRSEGNALGSLGRAFRDSGNPQKAMELFEDILIIAREMGNRRGEGLTLWNFALAYYQVGKNAQAVSFAEMALAIFEQLEHPIASEIHSYLEDWKSEQT
jgi:tetratricopeptide (TPR) repeat protein